MEGFFARPLFQGQWECLLPESLRLVKVVEFMPPRSFYTLLQHPLPASFMKPPKADQLHDLPEVEKCEKFYYIFFFTWSNLPAPTILVNSAIALWGLRGDPYHVQ